MPLQLGLKVVLYLIQKSNESDDQVTTQGCRWRLVLKLEIIFNIPHGQVLRGKTVHVDVVQYGATPMQFDPIIQYTDEALINMSFYIQKLFIGIKDEMLEPIWGQITLYQRTVDQDLERITDNFYFTYIEDKVKQIFFPNTEVDNEFNCFQVQLPTDINKTVYMVITLFKVLSSDLKNQYDLYSDLSINCIQQQQSMNDTEYFSNYFNEMSIKTPNTYTGKTCKQNAFLYQTTLHNTLTKIGVVQQPFLIGMFQLIKQNQSVSSSKIKLPFTKLKEQKEVKNTADNKQGVDNLNSEDIDPILQQKSEIEIFKSNELRRLSNKDDPNSSIKTQKNQNQTQYTKKQLLTPFDVYSLENIVWVQYQQTSQAKSWDENIKNIFLLILRKKISTVNYVQMQINMNYMNVGQQGDKNMIFKYNCYYKTYFIPEIHEQSFQHQIKVCDDITKFISEGQQKKLKEYPIIHVYNCIINHLLQNCQNDSAEFADKKLKYQVLSNQKLCTTTDCLKTQTQQKMYLLDSDLIMFNINTQLSNNLIIRLNQLVNARPNITYKIVVKVIHNVSNTVKRLIYNWRQGITDIPKIHLMRSYKSTVQYKQTSPIFSDEIRIKLPTDKIHEYSVHFNVYQIIFSSISQSEDSPTSKKQSDGRQLRGRPKSKSFSKHSFFSSPRMGSAYDLSRASDMPDEFDKQYTGFMELYGETEDDYDDFEDIQIQYYKLQYKGHFLLSDILKETTQIFDKKITLEQTHKSNDIGDKKDIQNPELTITCKLNSIYYINQPEIKMFYNMLFYLISVHDQNKGKQQLSLKKDQFNNFKELLTKFQPEELVKSGLYEDFRNVRTRLSIRDDQYQYLKIFVQHLPLLIQSSCYLLDIISIFQEQDYIRLSMFLINFLANAQFIIKNLVKYQQSQKKYPKIYFKRNIVQMVIQNNAFINEDLIYHAIFNKNIDTFNRVFNLQLAPQYVDSIDTLIEDYQIMFQQDGELQDQSQKEQPKQVSFQNVCSTGLQCCYDTSLYAENIQKDYYYHHQQTQLLHICKEFIQLKKQFFTLGPVIQKIYNNITALNQRIINRNKPGNKKENSKTLAHEVLLLHYQIQTVVTFMNQLTFNDIQDRITEFEQLVKQLFDVINYIKTIKIPNPSIVPICTQHMQFLITVISNVISYLLYQQVQNETNKKLKTEQDQQQSMGKINIITLITLVDQQYSQNKDLWEYPVQFQIFVYLTWNIIVLQNIDLLKQIFQQMLFILQIDNLRMKAIQVTQQFLQLFIMYMEKNYNANIKIDPTIRLQFAQQLITQLISVITKEWTQQDQYNLTKNSDALSLLRTISEALSFSGNEKKCFAGSFQHESQVLILERLIEQVYSTLDVQYNVLKIDNLRNENLYNYYSLLNKLLYMFDSIKVKLMDQYNPQCSQNFGYKLLEEQRSLTQKQLHYFIELILSQKDYSLKNTISFLLNLVGFIPLQVQITLLNILLSNLIIQRNENSKIELSIDEKTLICKAIFDVSQFYKRSNEVIELTEQFQKDIQWNKLYEKILYILVAFKDIDQIISSQLSNIQQWFYQQKTEITGVIEKILKDTFDQSGSLDVKIHVIKQKIEQELQVLLYQKSNRSQYIDIVKDILAKRKIDSQAEKNETINLILDTLAAEIKQKFINRLDFMRQFIIYCYGVSEEEKTDLYKLVNNPQPNIPIPPYANKQYDQILIEDQTNLSMSSTNSTHHVAQNEMMEDMSTLAFYGQTKKSETLEQNQYFKDFYRRIKRCSMVLDNQEKLFNIQGKNVNSLVLARQIEIMYDEYRIDLDYNQKLLKLNNIIQMSEENKMYIECAFQNIEKALLLNKQLTGNHQHWKLYDDLFPLTLGVFENKQFYMQVPKYQGIKQESNNGQITEQIIQCIFTAKKYFKYYHIQQIDFHLINVMRQMVRYMQMEDNETLQKYYITSTEQKNKQQNDAEIDLRIGFYYKVTRHNQGNYKQSNDDESKPYIYRQPTWQVLSKFQSEIQSYYEKNSFQQVAHGLPNKSESIMISEDEQSKSDAERDADLSIISILEYEAKPEKYQNNDVITIQTLSNYHFNSSEEMLLDPKLKMSNYIVQRVLKMMYEEQKRQTGSVSHQKYDSLYSCQNQLNYTGDIKSKLTLDNYDNYVVEAYRYISEMNLVLIAQKNIKQSLESDHSQKIYGQEVEFNFYKQSFPGCNVRQEIADIIILQYTPILKQVVDIHKKICELNSKDDINFIVDQLWSICATTVREGLVQGTVLLLQYYDEQQIKKMQMDESVILEPGQSSNNNVSSDVQLQDADGSYNDVSDMGRLKCDEEGRWYYDFDMDEELEMYIEQLHLILFQTAMKINMINQRQHEPEVRAVQQKFQTIQQMFTKIVIELQAQCPSVCSWFKDISSLLVPVSSASLVNQAK